MINDSSDHRKRFGESNVRPFCSMLRLRSAAGIGECLMLMLLCLSTTGCGTTDNAEAHDDHHMEHFVPQHKPASFAAAVEEIEHRSEHLTEHAGHGHDGERNEFQELIDIANWLPELAADSDLNEAGWTTARNVSGEMAAGLQKLLPIGNAAPDLKSLQELVTPYLKTLQPLVPKAGRPEPAMHHEHHHDHEHEHDHEHHDHESKPASEDHDHKSR